MFDDLTTDEYYNDTLIWGDDADYGDFLEYTWSDSDYDVSDVEADADTLASAGWGTDEDYGYYGGENAAMEGHLFGWDA